MNVWRIHIKADSETGIDPRQCCIKRGVIGVGWHSHLDIDWDKITVGMGKQRIVEEYEERSKEGCEEVREEDYRGATYTVKYEVKDKDLVWAKDSKGEYFIGCVTGECFFDLPEEYVTADTAGLRKCDWHKYDEALPQKLKDCFADPTAIRSITDDAIKESLRKIYSQKSGCEYTFDEFLDEEY